VWRLARPAVRRRRCSVPAAASLRQQRLAVLCAERRPDLPPNLQQRPACCAVAEQQQVPPSTALDATSVRRLAFRAGSKRHARRRLEVLPRPPGGPPGAAVRPAACACHGPARAPRRVLVALIWRCDPPATSAASGSHTSTAAPRRAAPARRRRSGRGSVAVGTSLATGHVSLDRAIRIPAAVRATP